MRRCTNPQCTLRWIDPTLTKADLGWAYRRYFTHESEEGSIPQRQSPVLRFHEGLLLMLGPGWARRRRARMNLPKDGGRLLDVGCGDGSLLATMQHRGWEVEGIDFDPVSAKEVANRLKVPVACGDIEDADLPEASFDAITLQHVIEHLPDPEKAIRRCMDLLKPGGHLVLVTPNTDSTYHGRFGRHWWPLEVPRHLHLYNMTSMGRLLARAGVSNARISSTTANNDSVYISSRRIQRQGSRGLNPRYSVAEIGRAVAALWWAWATHLLRRESGEELVVRIRKPADPLATR